MGLRVADGLLSRLIRTIDINGNGTIEFDEFCYMMFCLRRRHAGDVSDNPGTKSSVWAELDISAIRSSTEHSHKRGDVDSRMTKSVSHLHQTVDDDNSVSSRRSARSRGSIAESIRNLARVFTPRKASSVDPVALNEAVTRRPILVLLCLHCQKDTMLHLGRSPLPNACYPHLIIPAIGKVKIIVSKRSNLDLGCRVYRFR